MKIPYNRVHVRGDIIFAARGGSIHTFRLSDGGYISTWKHPDVDKIASVVRANAEKLASPTPEEASGPPTKRQKLADEGTPTEPAQDGQSKHFDGRGKRKAKKDDAAGWGRLARVPDRPVVTLMTTSEDGCHVLAVTGHDKALWVLAHDGQGGLTEVSRRVMPKRPSAVVLAPGAQIICADKFGDVYALPLLIDESRSGSATPLSSLPLPSKKAFKPSANAFTVHSKGNRKALENQILQAELDKQSGAVAQLDRPEGPDFELNLLLGHVSMLTCLTLGESQGRKYILTADRDEHIRVSRYMPQAHIIETFCMGHKEFVNDMVILPSPGRESGVLVSGGGDDSLFMWDWVSGKLLSKTNVLLLAQEIVPEVVKVAISGLYILQYPSANGPITFLLAICEDIEAIFSWRLTGGDALSHPAIIQIPGNPLHLTISPTEPTLIAAIDPKDDVKSLHLLPLTINEGKLAVSSVQPLDIKDEALAAEEGEILVEEVRDLLYTVESLRKLSTNFIAKDGDADVDE